jgi:hypothetical protein
MMSMSAPIGPESATFAVRDRQVTLTAMGGRALVEWGEMKILLGKELVAARQLCRMGKDHHARVAADTVLAGNIGLVCRATGCSPEWAADLSHDERGEIVRRQDVLNRVDLLEEWVEGFAARGVVEAGDAE